MQEPLVRTGSFLSRMYEPFKTLCGIHHLSRILNFLSGTNTIYEWSRSVVRASLHRAKTTRLTYNNVFIGMNLEFKYETGISYIIIIYWVDLLLTYWLLSVYIYIYIHLLLPFIPAYITVCVYIFIFILLPKLSDHHSIYIFISALPV